MNDQTPIELPPTPPPALDDSPRFSRARIVAAKRFQQALLAARKPGQPYPSLRKLGAYGRGPEPRVAFLSKGVGTVETPNGPRMVSNPGFPFVGRGKPIFAGGMPLGFDYETALAYLRERANIPVTPKETA